MGPGMQPMMGYLRYVTTLKGCAELNQQTP
jgi:hypothetical protein